MNKCIHRLKELQWQAFLVICVTLALLVGAELAARTYLALWERAAPQPVLAWEALKVPDLPRSEAYRGEDWVGDFSKNAPAGTFDYRTFYSPYRMWKYGDHEIDARTDLLGQYDPDKPRNKYVNVDRYGFVVTENPRKPACREKKTIFLFGGSTMANDGVIRDRDTIPSQLSQRLNAAFPDTCFELYNFGQSGYAVHNELVLLDELLSRGKIPDMVIFYDGVNDLLYRVVDGVPHMNYTSYRDTFKFFDSPYPNVLRLAAGLRNNLALFRLFFGPPEPPYRFSDDPAVIDKRAASVLGDYFGVVEHVRKMGEGYGFKTLAFFQPTLFTTGKKKTDEERELLAKVEQHVPQAGEGFRRGYAAYRRLAPAHAAVARDLTGAFDGEDGSVFVDFAHLSPRGNARVADAMFPVVRDAFAANR